jgi:DNA-binding response OmpR family regulator
LPKSDEPPSPVADDAKTVLVVDDEADIRRMLKRLLAARGYRVLEAERGKVALKMVKEHGPDLIVLDAMLPEVHGFDIARRIKGSKRYGQIPIIMVSAVYRGWRYAEDLKQSCGVDHFIEKPFKIADVLAAVESCLAAERPPAEAPEAVSDEAEKALKAGVEAYKAGRMDEAVAHLRHGISIDPLAYRLHYHLGLLYGRAGQVFEAISELETAVEINSRHFPAVKNLAILYQKAGFKNKAVEMWQRGLTVAPDEETKQSIKQHLLSLL